MFTLPLPPDLLCRPSQLTLRLHQLQLPGGTTTTSDATGTDARGDRNDHHDYGWIGLAGLLGLAGLMGRKRDDRYDTTSSGTRR